MKITLCGSTRFHNEFDEWNGKLTFAGHLVYSLALFGRQPSDVGKAADNRLINDNEKRHLDLIHLAKIEESDAIVVINPSGYIGESTLREVEWAHMRSKGVFVIDNHSVASGANEALRDAAWLALLNAKDASDLT